MKMPKAWTRQSCKHHPCVYHELQAESPVCGARRHGIPARKRDRPPLRGAALLVFLTVPAAESAAESPAESPAVPPDGGPTLPTGSGLAVLAPGAEGQATAPSAGVAVLAGGVFGANPPCRRGRGGVWRLGLAKSRLGLAAREGLRWAGGLPQALGCVGAAAEGAEPSEELCSGVWKPTVTLEGD